MLSFFSKKKDKPDTPPEEAIQGPQSNGDDFIFVERKAEDDPPKEPNQPFVYPPMPALPTSYNVYNPTTINSSSGPVPYVQDVPFEFAPQLNTNNVFEVTQLEVDGILAVLTRQMSIDAADEYNFTLERSICY
ncbi:uncharacterized protein LOC119669696 [Teleopsis dalmanni]|uniref:uncharacterized protein LOC119669696 n=1 Tax=Teleopsis dalmanni TaxID=139649 RepID=UPI0018CFA9E1|nr:uncharacterized protein LOC119669696 [Teleopsis dalmanni]